MDYGRGESRIKPVISSLQKIYPHDLQLYQEPPSGDITLTEFQELAIERIKVLRTVESVYVQTSIEPDVRLATVLSELRNDNSLSYWIKLLQGTGCEVHSESDLKARRKDHISHFILQLAHCSSEELKRWFISREVELFKLRYSSLNSEGLRQFLRINNLNYVPISKDEKEDIKEYLSQSTPSCSDAYIELHDFYKVPFREVTDLVRNRKVYVKSGFAYIPEKELISVFITILKSQLSSALTYTQRGLPILNSDDRVYPLLHGFDNTYTGVDYTVCENGSVPIEDLDALSKTSYPLCMRFTHETLRANHHLKHTNRQYYGLFLKGIGVLLEDAVRFWREEFTKLMDLDKFEKHYLYNIKHNYGKLGNRTNYTPYSCIKIINSNATSDQTHGCPFKEADAKILKQKMLSYGINLLAIQDITSLMEKKYYQIACAKYFEAVHKSPPLNPILHPNSYFKDSQNILNGVKPTNVTGKSITSEKSERKQSKVELSPSDLINFDFEFEDDMNDG